MLSMKAPTATDIGGVNELPSRQTGSVGRSGDLIVLVVVDGLTRGWLGGWLGGETPPAQ